VFRVADVSDDLFGVSHHAVRLSRVKHRMRKRHKNAVRRVQLDGEVAE
jgi:hypothetical protein